MFLWWFGHLALASLFAVLTLLLFYTHRENIKRLQAGTEGKIGEKYGCSASRATSASARASASRTRLISHSDHGRRVRCH